jgi:integrase
MAFKDREDGRCEVTYRDGRSRVRSRVFDSRALAEAHLIAEAGPASSSLKRQVRLEGLAESYFQNQRKRAASQRSISRLSSAVRDHLIKPLSNATASNVTVEMMLELLSGWQKASPYTIVDRMCLIERVFEHGHEHGVVAANVARSAFKDKRPPCPPSPPPVWPSEGEIARLRSLNLSLADRAVLELILETRPSGAELAALRWTEVLRRNGTPFEVQYHFVMQNGVEWRQPNPQRYREIELDQSAVWLKGWHEACGCPEDGYVFPGRIGGPRSDSAFNRIVRGIQLLADMPIRQSQRVGRRGGKRTKPSHDKINNYVPKYSLEQLGNLAVVKWYEAGHRGIALENRVGRSTKALGTWTAVFKELDMRSGRTGK